MDEVLDTRINLLLYVSMEFDIRFVPEGLGSMKINHGK